jgi:single-stranded-DNA-specific exonuclease
MQQMRWSEPIVVDVPDELRVAVGGHPLIAERLARSGILDPVAALAFLNPEHYSPSSPFDLPGMDRAADRVTRAIRDGERILVWGDFDVDGQSATALLYSTLLRAGANVSFHVPVREGEGHGINPRSFASG